MIKIDGYSAVNEEQRREDDKLLVSYALNMFSHKLQSVYGSKPAMIDINIIEDMKKEIERKIHDDIDKDEA